MIIVKLKGGLGNQLFQYASGLAMAKKYNEELKIDGAGYADASYIHTDTPRKYRLGAFMISGTLASKEEIDAIRNPYGIFSKVIRVVKQKVFKMYYVDYHPDFFSKRRSLVEGYFQSEKNFSDIADIVKAEFKLKKECESLNFLESKNIINTSKQSVSVHIRRGDYVAVKANSAFWGIASKEYYGKAMEYISSKIDSPVFYFFSDDIEWVKKEFGEDKGFVFMSKPELQDYEELTLMSSCSHNIIANSSFSWWGAWLNTNPEKIVVCPKKWLNTIPNPHPNIIPNSWVSV